jgi:hypothetical protein
MNLIKINGVFLLEFHGVSQFWESPPCTLQLQVLLSWGGMLTYQPQIGHANTLVERPTRNNNKANKFDRGVMNMCVTFPASAVSC